jgi:pSer/pThr/pTyr-binding forkhead associated (FHA) protein
MTIGRAGSSDILLDRDDLTSRHHALLKRDNNHFLIFDRRSANGVKVNGLPIQSDTGYPLIDGDDITIGNYQLTFRAVIHTAIDQSNRSLASTP